LVVLEAEEMKWGVVSAGWSLKINLDMGYRQQLLVFEEAGVWEYARWHLRPLMTW
jgi:hypothetical protein